MNAVSLVARVKRRIPGYTDYEYLDEVNAAYKETWDYILQLDDSYFTDIKTLTVNTQAQEFDFLYNSNGNLSGPASNRYFQIDRIRILQPGDTNWIPASPRGWNDPEMLAMAEQTPQTASTVSPYIYNPFAKGSVLFARPLPVGAQIEIVYSFRFLELQMLSNGTVTSSGASVTGTSTTFTQIVGADNQLALPGTDQDTDIGIELILGGNQNYRVKTLTTNTALTTINAVSPAVSTATYQLATVPDIPDGHHNVISTIATRNFMSTPGDDARFSEWASLAKIELDSMRDSIMTRQRQMPAQRRRFPYGLTRHFVVPASR